MNLQNTSSDFVIPASMLADLELTPQQLRVDLALFLYDQEKLSMGKARKLAGLSQIDFQKAMQKAGVYIKYGVQDLQDDIDTYYSLPR